jgi:lauroyl/myristoyl acyltransferase
MLAAWGWGTYIFFAGFLAAGIVWVWFCLPETMNTTLEDMDKVFGSKTGEADAIMLDEARRDVGIGMIEVFEAKSPKDVV